jgi:PAS domain S-box-containing protein
MLGYESEDEFPNKLERWKESLHPDDSQCILKALDRHLHDHDGYDVEYRLQMKSGSYRWFNARGLAIRRPDGQAYIMSGSLRDIHDRKEAEEEVRRRDVYLVQKQKMEALGELAGEMAHEFNNLLQAISGQLEFADRSLPYESDAKQELSVAMDLIQKSAHFTRRLLDFSRQRFDGIEPIAMNKLATSLAAVLRPLLSERIDLRFRLGKRAGHVVADPAAMQQALLNLCINARDAMPEGGTLTVITRRARISQKELARHPGALIGSYSTISIRDTGCGLTEESKAKIFAPFFTTKAVGKGSGLGLAVVHKSVMDCGGFIDVQSSPGCGATFTLWLPLAKSVKRSTASVKRRAEKVAPTRRATILYAEDKESVRQATARILQLHGHEVVSAKDGAEAVRLFEEHRAEIDLALLDVIMPGMGGDAVFHRMREHAPGIPVVFCSGYVSQLIGNDVLQSKNTWLIDKPFEAEKLLDTLELALNATQHD